MFSSCWKFGVICNVVSRWKQLSQSPGVGKGLRVTWKEWAVKIFYDEFDQNTEGFGYKPGFYRCRTLSHVSFSGGEGYFNPACRSTQYKKQNLGMFFCFPLSPYIIEPTLSEFHLLEHVTRLPILLPLTSELDSLRIFMPGFVSFVEWLGRLRWEVPSCPAR